MCSTMLIPKRMRTNSCSPPPEVLFQASTLEHAARPRITAHAGPKAQFGGVHLGLVRFSYQGPTVVIQPPMPRTSKVMVAATMTGKVNIRPFLRISSVDHARRENAGVTFSNERSRIPGLRFHKLCDAHKIFISPAAQIDDHEMILLFTRSERDDARQGMCGLKGWNDTFKRRT